LSTYAETTARIAEETGLSKTAVDGVLDALRTSVHSELKAGGDVYLPGLGRARAVYSFALDVFEAVALLAPPLPTFSLVDYSAFSLPKVRAFLSRVSERLRYRAYRPV